MKRTRLTTSVKNTVKVSQRITIVKYVAAGTLIVTILGVAAFFYFNLGSSEDAEAGSRPEGGMEEVVDNTYKIPDQQKLAASSVIDFASYLNGDEMKLLMDRSFVRDTTRKEYTSVKWNLNESFSHLTLEVSNSRYEYSLEVFDKNGSRVLYFAHLTDEKFMVDKFDLVSNHEYSYVVKNIAGELYAGNLRF